MMISLQLTLPLHPIKMLTVLTPEPHMHSCSGFASHEGPTCLSPNLQGWNLVPSLVANKTWVANQLFLGMINIPEHDWHVRTYVHHENRSLIQSLALMCSATRAAPIYKYGYMHHYECLGSNYYWSFLCTFSVWLCLIPCSISTAQVTTPTGKHTGTHFTSTLSMSAGSYSPRCFEQITWIRGYKTFNSTEYQTFSHEANDMQTF